MNISGRLGSSACCLNHDGCPIRGPGLTNLKDLPDLTKLRLGCPTLTDLLANRLGELKSRRAGIAGWQQPERRGTQGPTRPHQPARAGPDRHQGHRVGRGLASKGAAELQDHLGRRRIGKQREVRCGAGWIEELVYVAETDRGQETLTPDEFAAKYGWKNDPERVRLTAN